MIYHDLSNLYKPHFFGGWKQGKLATSWEYCGRKFCKHRQIGINLGFIAQYSNKMWPTRGQNLGDWNGTNENEDHPTSIGVFCDHHWFPSEMTKLPTRWYLGAPHCLGYPQILTSCCPWVLKKTRWVPAKYPSYPIIPAKKQLDFRVPGFDVWGGLDADSMSFLDNLEGGAEGRTNVSPWAPTDKYYHCTKWAP